MTQPPYPPQGGNESGGEQPGASGRGQPGSDDDPTKKFDHPFGLASYALTYAGYQVLNNALTWRN